jgi:hypothetical protein
VTSLEEAERLLARLAKIDHNQKRERCAMKSLPS